MLRYGIIGCGAAANAHLYGLLQNSQVTITALCEPGDLAPAFAHLGVKQYDSYAKLLAAEKVDAVSIVTPHYLHEEQVRASIQKGIHVLCEKPLALSYAGAEQLVQESAAANSILGMMFQRRFFNNTKAIEEVIRQEALGNIRKIEYELQVQKGPEYYAGWRGRKEQAGGGVLLCQGLHDIDRLVQWFGMPAVGQVHLTTTREDIEVEDEAEVELEFPGGIPGYIMATTNSTPDWNGRISISGEKGTIVINSDRAEIWEVPGMSTPEPNRRATNRNLPSYYDFGHELVIEDFISAIIEQRDPICSGKSSLPALQLLFDIYGTRK